MQRRRRRIPSWKLTPLGKVTAAGLLCVSAWALGPSAAPLGPPLLLASSGPVVVQQIELGVPCAGALRFEDQTGAGLRIESLPRGVVAVHWGDGWQLQVSGSGCGRVDSLLLTPDGTIGPANLCGNTAYGLGQQGVVSEERLGAPSALNAAAPAEEGDGQVSYGWSHRGMSSHQDGWNLLSVERTAVEWEGIRNPLYPAQLLSR